ncbi:hypothetical protein [Maridesulfovibrio bastinii]|uniref:hypothetical protein n=1 Tax=Maridesulfovibrio bastinii TaxID=47157 RepID=UPI000403DF01|nr:hypothetical protein [Maridesulfovibrio bastinii]
MNARVFFMASFSRSGETVLLRHLNAHPEIVVPYNIKAQETERSLQLFDYVRNNNVSSLSDKECAQFGIKKPVVLLKQIWEHIHSFNGFILVRNPASVVSSILRQAKDGDIHKVISNVRRWAGMIDESLSLPISDNIDRKNMIAAIASTWARRMQGLYNTEKQVFYYEDFVCNPEINLRRICKHLNINFAEEMLHAHKNYKEGIIGHGGIQLSSKIHTRSLYSYQDELTQEEFDLIRIITLPIANAFGYSLKWNKVTITPVQLQIPENSLNPKHAWNVLQKRLVSENLTLEQVNRLRTLMENVIKTLHKQSFENKEQTSLHQANMKQTTAAFQALEQQLTELQLNQEKQTAGTVKTLEQQLAKAQHNQKEQASSIFNALEQLLNKVQQNQREQIKRLDSNKVAISEHSQKKLQEINAQAKVLGNINFSVQELLGASESQGRATGKITSALNIFRSNIEKQGNAVGTLDKNIREFAIAVEKQTEKIDAIGQVQATTETTIQTLVDAVHKQSSETETINKSQEYVEEIIQNFAEAIEKQMAETETINNFQASMGATIQALVDAVEKQAVETGRVKRSQAPMEVALQTLAESVKKQKTDTSNEKLSQAIEAKIKILDAKVSKSINSINSVKSMVNTYQSSQPKNDLLDTQQKLLDLAQQQNIELLEKISSLHSTQYFMLRNRFDNATKTVFSLDLKKMYAHNDLEIIQTHEGLELKSTGGDPQLLAATLWSTFFNYRYVLKIVIDSERQTMLELFYKTADDLSYSRGKKLQAPIIEGTNTIYLDLDIHKIREQLRLDPGSCSGKFLLREFEIRRV